MKAHQLEMRVVLVASDRWSIGVEHPAGHVVLVPITYRTHDEAHRALVAWSLDAISDMLADWS